ncbi:MAG: tripartite tricarboxylate transporter substrate binding protein [Betaproteobacteria bacterium]|nr:MAG: tripartite tricarboxylate transporter substrate binding protein [Betaproteobacteria bacterium]
MKSCLWTVWSPFYVRSHTAGRNAVRNIGRLLVMLALAATSAAFAQGYPNRPIKVIVPWPPGQTTDIAARMVSEKLAPPNVQKVPYDPVTDFSPISQFTNGPYVLVTHPSFPAANVKEFISLLRANPDKYSYSSSGSGAISHLISEVFLSMAKITATHVPYKGSAQALTDVVGGQVTYTFETPATVLGHVKAGRLKALGVSSANRAIALPELPTIAEAGDLPGFDMRGWIGLLAPAGIPRELRMRLATESRKILQAPEMRERFIALGLEPAGLMLDEFADFLKKQNNRYASIVKQANVKAD